MFEKVNPAHPDKVADRIAGAIVDLAYQQEENPKVAVEVLIGHGFCNIVIESNIDFEKNPLATNIIYKARRLTKQPYLHVNIISEKQDTHLANNQSQEIRCGDNGIFKGVPTTEEQKELSVVARYIYDKIPYDGKYILDGEKLIICQSNCKNKEIKDIATYLDYKNPIINPLGEWTGGIDVDTGATNRKLGSDMGDSVTGGGLHGKDLSKADVSVNIYAYLKAQETGKEVKLCCAIGDDTIDGKPYTEIVKIAREFIKSIGGFEKFAEWGLI